MICNYTYGLDHRLASIVYTLNDAVLDSFIYSYDEVGNISRIDRPGWAVAYSYDLNNQLIATEYEGNTTMPDEWYSYDAVGNRLSSHLSDTYVYDELNRLLEDDQHWYEWDDNGNLTLKGNKADGSFMTLTHDAENRLRRITKSDGTMIEYGYDARGRRVARSVNGMVERYHYSGNDVLFDTNEDPALTTRYINLPGAIDQKLYAVQGNQQYVYLRDHLGTIWKVIDQDGAVVQNYAYDSFGQVLGNNSSLPNRYTYTGREIEPEAGLYYYRARFYDAGVGRFVEEDRINNFLLSVNAYIYNENSPVDLSDPYGNGPWYGNYCGPGSNKWQLPFVDGGVDFACWQHDLCYDKAGLGGIFDALGLFINREEECRKAICDNRFCSDLEHSVPYTKSARRARDSAIFIFCSKPVPTNIPPLSIPINTRSITLQY